MGEVRNDLGGARINARIVVQGYFFAIGIKEAENCIRSLPYHSCAAAQEAGLNAHPCPLRWLGNFVRRICEHDTACINREGKQINVFWDDTTKLLTCIVWLPCFDKTVASNPEACISCAQILTRCLGILNDDTGLRAIGCHRQLAELIGFADGGITIDTAVIEVGFQALACRSNWTDNLFDLIDCTKHYISADTIIIFNIAVFTAEAIVSIGVDRKGEHPGAIAVFICILRVKVAKNSCCIVF